MTLATLLAAAAVLAPSARAEAIGPYDFDPPEFELGDIDGQNGWSLRVIGLASPDAEINEVADFPDAAGYGFGDQALRFSNAAGNSGRVGIRTPALVETAGESTAGYYGADVDGFAYAFRIGSTTSEYQPNLQIHVSPSGLDDSPMSLLRFVDQEDGIHVWFVGASNPGPFGATTDFPQTDIATLDRGTWHDVYVAVQFVEGGGDEPLGNDVVKVFIDGELAHEGGTWENYFRYDKEQSINSNTLPKIDTLFSYATEPLAPESEGKGYLFDDVWVQSAPVETPVNEELPEIFGEAKVGKTLTCDYGFWTDNFGVRNWTVQWQRNGEPIDDATDDDYTAIAEDEGQELSCQVTAINTFGYTSTTESDAVVVAGADPDPDPDPHPEPEPQPSPSPAPAPAPAPAPKPGKPEIYTRGAPVVLQGASASVARLRCQGPSSCTIQAPRKVQVKLGGKKIGARVIVPKHLAAGKMAKVKIKLPARLLKELRGTAAKRGSVRVWLVIRSASGKQLERLTIRLLLPGKARKQPSVWL